MINKTKFQNINAYLSRQKQILAGYIYGSKTTDANPQSDLDIALVLEYTDDIYNKFFEISQRITHLLRSQGLKEEIDIRPIIIDNKLLTPLNKSLLFNFEAIKPSQLFYQKDAKKVALFEIIIVRQYRDYQRINSIRYQYFESLIKNPSYGYLKH